MLNWVLKVCWCCLVMASLGVNSCVAAFDSNAQRAGIYDLARWGEDRQAVILNGDWGFAWQQQLTPNDWDEPQPPWFNIPSTWDMASLQHQAYSGIGYATFTAKLINVPAGVDWSLMIPEQSTAFRLFIGDRLISEGGIAGVSAASTEAYSGNQLIELGRLPSVVKLTFQLSNYHHNSGGPWQSLVLSPRSQLHQAYTKKSFSQALVVALALLASAFLFLQHIVDRSDKGSLMLSIFAWLVALRVGITENQPLYDFLGNVPWSLHIRLLYLDLLLMMPTILYWQRYVFPLDTPKRTVQLCSMLFILPILSVILLPSWLFTSYLVVFQLLMVVVAGVYGWILYRVIRNQREGGAYVAMAMASLFVCALHDMAISMQWTNDNGSWISYGMLSFLLFLAVNMLYLRAQQSKHIESLSEQLFEANKQLEARVVQRTLELGDKADALEEANEKLKVLANIDGLTGLLNRRAFIEQLGMLARTKPEVAVVMIDVDYFKKINDEHGHSVGDDVLQRLAKLLSDIKREDDRVGRFGGEEFVILLQGMEDSGIESYCRRLLHDVQKLSFSNTGLGGISVSVGTSTGTLTQQNIDSLLQRADQAMYHVKRNGRNNFHASHPSRYRNR